MTELIDKGKKGLFGFFKPDEEYHFEMWGRGPNREPVFKWFNPRDESWTVGDIHGHNLPKHAKKYVGDTAYKYQKTYLEEHGESPWGNFHDSNVKNIDKLNEQWLEKKRLKDEATEISNKER